MYSLYWILSPLSNMGGWTNLLRTQLKEFVPKFIIPDYSGKYRAQLTKYSGTTS